MSGEGIIQFHADHQEQALSLQRYGDLACKLIAWREVLAMAQLVGQTPFRYEGAGFGNVSGRVGPPSAPRGKREFLITGTQTGGVTCVALEHFCLVKQYDYQSNTVQSLGMVQPSSESMTHGAIYDLSPHIRFVLHAHSPTIWQYAQQLNIPISAKSIAYGTPQMALEMQRLYQSTTFSETQIMAMGGHEDGIVVFGRSSQDAGQVLITYLACAYEALCQKQGVCCTRP